MRLQLCNMRSPVMLAPWMIFPQSPRSLSQVTMATAGRKEPFLAWKGNKCRKLHILCLVLNLSFVCVCVINRCRVQFQWTALTKACQQSVGGHAEPHGQPPGVCPAVPATCSGCWAHTHTVQVTSRRMIRTDKNRENKEKQFLQMHPVLQRCLTLVM